MKIGDTVYVHGYIDEIRKDVVIIRNNGGYFGTVPSEVVCGEMPERRGKWEKRTDKEGRTYGACSACGAIQYAGLTRFCHNCGADMRQGGGSE